jgi:hypothetical protein
MVKIVIRPSIAYSFSVVPYYMADIRKLDKKIIALQKAICGLPHSTPNITTQFLHNLFGLDAFSFNP